MATGTGNLPYPGKVYVPFDILTAQELNEDVANIESLATGAGIGDGAIATADIANSAVTFAKTSQSDLPRFLAYRAGAQNTTAGGTIDLVFDTEIYDIGSHYSTSTGTFTAPYNLTLFVTCGAQCETLTRYFFSARGTATATPARSLDIEATGIRRSFGSFIVPMTTGQTFGVSFWANSAVSVASSDTYMQGFVISKN